MALLCGRIIPAPGQGATECWICQSELVGLVIRQIKTTLGKSWQKTRKHCLKPKLTKQRGKKTPHKHGESESFLQGHRVSFGYLKVLLSEPLYNANFFCNYTFVQHIFEDPYEQFHSGKGPASICVVGATFLMHPRLHQQTCPSFHIDSPFWHTG